MKLDGRWIEGAVAEDVGEVVGPDGAKYKVKEHHQQYLEPGMAVRFVPRLRRFRGEQRAIRCVPVAMWPKNVPFEKR